MVLQATALLCPKEDSTMKARQCMTSSLAALLLIAAIAGQPAAKDFSQTCSHLSLQGTYLSAVCMTLIKCTPHVESPCLCDFLGMNCRIGQPTAIDLNQGISNEKGHLRLHGANFARSCSNLHLEVTSGYELAMAGSVTLHATCKVGEPWTLGVPAMLDLNTGITNNKGRLEFDQ